MLTITYPDNLNELDNNLFLALKTSIENDIDQLANSSTSKSSFSAKLSNYVLDFLIENKPLGRLYVNDFLVPREFIYVVEYIHNDINITFTKNIFESVENPILDTE